MHTILRLVPAGAGAAPSFSVAPGDTPIPVGLLPVELSLDPAPGEGAALLRTGAYGVLYESRVPLCYAQCHTTADVRHEVEQQATLAAERARALFEWSKAWWTEYKAVDPSFKARIGVKMYAPNERNEFHPACTYVSPIYAGET